MFFPGLGIVFLCVFGGYIVAGGNIVIILKAAPIEIFIIGGSAAGAFIIANTKSVLGNAAKGFKDMLAGPKYTKEDYLELLSLLYMIFKLLKTKGNLAIETHIENPSQSDLFKNFPKVLNDHHILDFLCDYLRMMTMGADNPHQMEDVMNEELETHHKEKHRISGALQTVADGLPALGIVAAVLGVIKTMAAIDQPPEVLGKMIGSALVGTFLGVFMAYGMAGPVASNLAQVHEEESKYFECIKAGLIAYMNGFPPAVAIEFARKTLFSHVRPSFYDVEQRVQNLPKAA